MSNYSLDDHAGSAPSRWLYVFFLALPPTVGVLVVLMGIAINLQGLGGGFGLIFSIVLMTQAPMVAAVVAHRVSKYVCRGSRWTFVALFLVEVAISLYLIAMFVRLFMTSWN